MRLDAYMREQKLTQAALGSMLNPPVSQSQVSQWFRGRTSITLDQALQIQLITKGEVTPADCAMVGLPDESTTPAAA
ncbi:helix-turn-helix transcriptional regulator [Burkholderia gladioli]|jgi:DNA-binding transcriptional regulator YdaS (Cro superfamily)|uniref:helix-turn-helix domain-containing protein n=1 Tax=Burkholderia gladioli TaxID=28095 RepID=UPI003015C7CD